MVKNNTDRRSSQSNKKVDITYMENDLNSALNIFLNISQPCHFLDYDCSLERKWSDCGRQIIVTEDIITLDCLTAHLFLPLPLPL